MTDADKLVEDCARAYRETMGLSLENAMRAIIAIAVERCAEACEQEEQTFLSPEYATGQPLSSFQERFACGQCAAAIRSLSPNAKGEERT